jgi:hypothetical protein
MADHAFSTVKRVAESIVLYACLCLLLPLPLAWGQDALLDSVFPGLQAALPFGWTAESVLDPDSLTHPNTTPLPLFNIEFVWSDSITACSRTFLPRQLVCVYGISDGDLLLAAIEAARLHSWCIPVFYAETPAYFLLTSPCYRNGGCFSDVSQELLDQFDSAVLDYFAASWPPCTYDRFAGTARVDSIAPMAGLGGPDRYDPFFRFSSPELPGDVADRFDLDQAYVMTSPVHFIKPGHTYPCSLALLAAGNDSCDAYSFHLYDPTSWEGYDTSSIWTYPDTVQEDQPFRLHLINHDFCCASMFSDLTSTVNDSSIRLTFWERPDPALTCVTVVNQFHGIGYDLSGLPAGTYSVYSERLPDCHPCRMASTTVLAGSLEVVPAGAARDLLHGRSAGRAGLAVHERHGLLYVRAPWLAEQDVTVRVVDVAGRAWVVRHATADANGVLNVAMGTRERRMCAKVCFVQISTAKQRPRASVLHVRSATP